MDDFLDLSWTEETNRLINSQTLYPCEPMSTIGVQCIYISSSLSVHHIKHETLSLQVIEGSGSILSEEVLLHTIQNNKQLGETRYKYDGLATYFVTLNQTNIFQHVQNPEGSFDFFSEKNRVDTLFIPSTLFIFHSINTIFLFFRELTLVTQSPLIALPLTSILKKQNGIKVTKRVRIASELPIYKASHSTASHSTASHSTASHSKTAKKSERV